MGGHLLVQPPVGGRLAVRRGRIALVAGGVRQRVAEHLRTPTTPAPLGVALAPILSHRAPHTQSPASSSACRLGSSSGVDDGLLVDGESDGDCDGESEGVSDGDGEPDGSAV